MALILVFVNKSKLADVSDYAVRVMVGDGTPERSRIITQAYLKGHTRSDGWQKLVQQFLTEEGERENRRKNRT